MPDNIAYFDNAATTFPKPECVYQAMDSFNRNCGVSLGRGQHRLSSQASYIADETRELLLQLFHCSNKEVAFTNTATEALNVILNGIDIPSGANVYISPFEHNAVTRTLHHLRSIKTFNIIQLSVNKENFTYNLNDISSQFNKDKPHCVIVSHASNVIGAIAPINEIFSIAKRYNAITIADMCQTAGLIDTDISSNILDYTVFAGHKTLYGPLGISGFIGNNLSTLRPIIYGGTGIESANQDMPITSPERFEAGSHNTVAIAGLNASLKWMFDTGIDNIRKKEHENYAKLCAILDKYENIKYFKPVNSVGVVSCLFDGYSSDEIGQVLSENYIAFRSGLHCAPYAHKFISTFPAGTVRLSVSYFNTENDFEMIREVLQYISDNS